MSKSQEQSIKEHIRTLSKERNSTFAELWHNLILERFLARLHQSEYKKHFIFKGGSLLARYINLGRETRDLDFLVKQAANTIENISYAINRICNVDLNDAFFFEQVKIIPLAHLHMRYTGAQVVLLARLGKTRTHLQIDLGFGDIVESINHPIFMTATRKGPLFESQILLRCYPREFIFAEKLETAIYRGITNSRMKDFHDLYSLVAFPKCLNAIYTEKVVINVFKHRQASLNNLPLRFNTAGMQNLQSQWDDYCKNLKSNVSLPSSFRDIISTVNHWLSTATGLCTQKKSHDFLMD